MNELTPDEREAIRQAMYRPYEEVQLEQIGYNARKIGEQRERLMMDFCRSLNIPKRLLDGEDDNP